MDDNDDVEKLLLDHTRKFDTFHDDWKNHRLEAKEAMRKVDTIHASLVSIAPNVAQLTHIPTVSATLLRMENKFMESAAGDSRMPTSVTMKIMGFSLLMVLIIGAALVVVLMRGNNMTTSIGGANGLSIKSELQTEVTKQNK